jgi:hypothetical protein
MVLLCSCILAGHGDFTEPTRMLCCLVLAMISTYLWVARGRALTNREQLSYFSSWHNMTKATSSSLYEIGFARGDSEARKKVIRSIGGRLCQARLGAESIQNPVIAYFIDMATAELEQMTTVNRVLPRLKDGRNESRVVQFSKPPAKGALPIR